MVANNKILTVSYGTFSCTLEGFEDSFGTMTAIAEYFRDLAADDRYFGAVRPVPDADMLTRIAEREVARRVEARMDASGIVLRMGGALDAGATTVRPGARTAKRPPSPQGQPQVAMPPAVTAPAQAFGITFEIAAPAGDTLAKPISAPIAELAAEAMPDGATAEMVAADAPVVIETLADTDGAAFAPIAAVGAYDYAAEAAPITLPSHPDADSVAAKLQRIRAVVGRAAGQPSVYAAEDQNAPAAPDWPAVAEAAPADDAWAEDVELGDDVDLETLYSHSAEADADAEAAEIAAEDFRVAAPTETDSPNFVESAEIELHSESVTDIARSSAAIPVTEPEPEPVADTEVSAESPVVMAPAPIRPRVIRMRRADFDAAVAAGAIPGALTAPQAQPADAASEPETSAPVLEAANPAGDQGKVTEAMADAVAVDRPEDRHADLETGSEALPTPQGLAEDPAIEDLPLYPEMDDYDDLTDLSLLDGTPAETESGLSSAEEAELLQELAAVEQAAQLAEPEAPQGDESLVASGEAADSVPVTVAEDVIKDTETDEDATLAAILAKARMRTMGVASPEQTPETLLPTDAETAAAQIPAEVVETQSGGGLITDNAPARDLAGPDLGPQADHTPADVLDTVDATEDNIFAGLDLPEADDDTERDTPSDAEATAADNSDTAEDDASNATLADRPGRDRLRDAPLQDEAAMSRLLTQTDAQFNAPEASRRRDAIAQLKAAVAATEADRRLGEVRKRPDAASEDAFRDDLRQVVRPRRPSGPVQPEARSERPRPAPLKLVASQRIDLPADTERPSVPAMPVRPRRVSIDAEPMARSAPDVAVARANAGSFTDFAEAMGASSLSDMLEAAAAYTAFIEGSEDFSRPQLLTKVREIAPQDFSREDGLRSFGTLLREGRIVRGRPGRFLVNEDTRFRPERHAG